MALPLVLVVGCSTGATSGQSPQTVTVTASTTSVTSGQSPQTVTVTASTTGAKAHADPAPRFNCKVLETNGLQYAVTTSGGTYDGRITVEFQDYPNSGHIFPPTHVTGASDNATWRPVPEDDIGASAQPTTCAAVAG